MEKGKDKNLIHCLEERYNLQVRMHPGLLLTVALKLMRESFTRRKSLTMSENFVMRLGHFLLYPTERTQQSTQKLKRFLKLLMTKIS